MQPHIRGTCAGFLCLKSNKNDYERNVSVDKLHLIAMDRSSMPHHPFDADSEKLPDRFLPITFGEAPLRGLLRL